jgi:hypothetical protein
MISPQNRLAGHSCLRILIGSSKPFRTKGNASLEKAHTTTQFWKSIIQYRTKRAGVKIFLIFVPIDQSACSFS